MKNFEDMNEQMIDHLVFYSDVYNTKEDIVKNVLKNGEDVYLTADEAVRHGFCDEVVGRRKRRKV